MKQRLLRLVDPVLQSGVAGRMVLLLVKLWTSSTARLSPEEGLRRMFVLDDHVRQRIDGLAIRLDDGVHAKHRLTGYHGFFLGHVSAGERVLDVGCGKGELAADLAAHGARVTGIDIDAGSIAFARERFASPNLELVHADILRWQPPHDFEVVVLSNVLEHIAARVELLTRLEELAHPSRFLIRVPSIERDWIVAQRRELGISYFSDPTHETEYTLDQLHEELRRAGLEPADLVQRWGELWTAARPTARVTLPR